LKLKCPNCKEYFDTKGETISEENLDLLKWLKDLEEETEVTNG
tara:strand:+ start:516 stop:644 length:129 start_codon:yes stop_codon:yes gene_type:complete